MSYLGLWSCIGTNVKLGRLEGLNKKGRFLSPSTSLDTIVTVEIETLSKPSHFYFWQSKRSCCTCKAPRGSTWRWDRALQRADEGHNNNYGTTVYTEWCRRCRRCLYLWLGVKGKEGGVGQGGDRAGARVAALPWGWAEVLPREGVEGGFGNHNHQNVNGGYNIHNLCQ